MFVYFIVLCLVGATSVKFEFNEFGIFIFGMLLNGIILNVYYSREDERLYKKYYPGDFS